MISDFPLTYLLLPFLYAETHYRFKYFLSYLYKREPEIIADLPSRLEPETPLPILIIVKDAHLFPVFIHEAQLINADTGDKVDTIKIEQYLEDPLWEYLHFFESRLLVPGDHKLDIHISYSVGGNRKTCVNDNHRGSSHEPLPVIISADKLPRIGNCLYGDVHVHTNYTSDQVEFAPTIKTITMLARSMGLNFFCATDHSYDLDDLPNNYLVNDSGLSKWYAFLKEVDIFNQQESGFLIIPGEEVSIRNHLGKNVHCLVYNSQRFFPGSGDGAERWPDTRCELSLSDLLTQLDRRSLSFAAHPGEKPAFLQRLLINRGQWTAEDCRADGLTGLQLINSADNDSDLTGKKLWIQTLLQGKKSIGICGTDAHGNFARYRQIGFPFFTMKEHYCHLFGQWRTGIYPSSKKINIRVLLDGLKNGLCFMTNGPALRFSVHDKTRDRYSGDKTEGTVGLNIQALTTPEFNTLSKIVLYLGFFGQREEILYKLWNLPENIYQFDETILFETPGKRGYLRMEVETAGGKQALSNPIWF